MPPTVEPTVEPLERLFTVDEAAAVTGLRPATIRQWIWLKKIAVVRPGGARLVRIAESEVRRVRSLTRP